MALGENFYAAPLLGRWHADTLKLIATKHQASWTHTCAWSQTPGKEKNETIHIMQRRIDAHEEEEEEEREAVKKTSRSLPTNHVFI